MSILLKKTEFEERLIEGKKTNIKVVPNYSEHVTADIAKSVEDRYNSMKDELSPFDRALVIGEYLYTKTDLSTDDIEFIVYNILESLLDQTKTTLDTTLLSVLKSLTSKNLIKKSDCISALEDTVEDVFSKTIKF